MSEIINEYIFPVISQRDRKMPFIIATVGREDQKRIYRPSGIEHHQFLFTLSGSGETIIKGKKYDALPGTLMYHAPNDVHNYYPSGSEWKVCWLTFLQSYNLFSQESGVYQIGDVGRCSLIVDEILQLEQDVLYGERASVILYKLLLEVNRYIGNENYSESADKLRSAMDYINSGYFYDIELDTLSGLCNISKEYFCRLFKKTYGVTPFSYIKSLRMQEAKKRLLLNKKQSLFKIAKDVGYHSANYFVTDFKRLEGIAPSEFRRRHQSVDSEVFDDMT